MRELKSAGVSSRGFTLIELLIVIAVIGILAAVTLVLINPLAQIGKTRDSQRKTTLRSLANDLEAYATAYGQYPITGTIAANYWLSSEPGDLVGNNGGDWIPGLVASGQVKTLPKDPKGGQGREDLTVGCSAWKSAYLYRSDDGACYGLLAHCSIEATQWNSSDVFYDSVRPTWAWEICNPAGSICCSYP